MVRIRPSALLLLVLALLLPEVASAASEARIIVKREPGLDAAERRDIRADAGVTLVETLSLPRTEVVSAPDPQGALRELARDPDVEYAEVDRPVYALSDDPYFNRLWGLENTGTYFGGSLADADMDVPEAWELSTGFGQTVAVVDTGVDLDHPDLAGRLAAGRDWVQDDLVPDDGNGHGTHVAGTIVATRDNGLGVAGVAPEATVVPLRVLDNAGTGTTQDVVEAFDYAGDQGIPIVNASFSSDVPAQSERDAIAAHPGTLYVAAAGNGGDDGVGDDNDGPVTEYPCAYDLANLICVGASDPAEQPSDFSNYGATTVDLFAPGDTVYSTTIGAYGYKSGTSMAVPHVAGAAALARASGTGLTTAQVKALLLQTADRREAYDGISLTAGRANVDAAVQLAANGGEIGDGDHDGFANSADACPAAAAPFEVDGCPDVPPPPADRDGDGFPDAGDSCPTTPGTVNGCPPPPPVTPTTPPALPPTPPADRDGDGRLDAADGCPTEAAATADGCPKARVRSLSAKAKRRVVTVRVRADRSATVAVTVERKRCRRGRCRWVRVARRTVASQSGSVKVRVKRLERGSHRVVVKLSSRAGAGQSATRGFRVR